LHKRAAVVTQGPMVVLRASCSGGSRGCGGCEGTTLATVVVAQGSGLS